MTNQKILERAIKKAIDGGWLPDSLSGQLYDTKALSQQHRDSIARGLILTMFSREGRLMPYHYTIIFDKGFAKALWGEELVGFWQMELRKVKPEDEVVGQPRWEVHLQRMVISEDPMKYLGEHLDA